MDKAERDRLRERVGTELYVDGCTYYYGLRPAEVRELLDAIDAMEAERDEARAAREVAEGAWATAQRRTDAMEAERDEALRMIGHWEDAAKLREDGECPPKAHVEHLAFVTRERDELRADVASLIGTVISIRRGAEILGVSYETARRMAPDGSEASDGSWFEHVYGVIDDEGEP